jgi:hypothetical protein
MRMIKPSPGECADRQTILKLKVASVDPGESKVAGDQVHVMDAGGSERTVNRTLLKNAPKVNVQPFLLENEEIQRYLEQYWFPDFPRVGDRYDELFDGLADVNERLWKLEDEARVLRAAEKNTDTIYRAATVLFEITEENDKRSELVREINRLFSIDTQEKVYA